jgi:Xaa-Pro aminopeptidase
VSMPASSATPRAARPPTSRAGLPRLDHAAHRDRARALLQDLGADVLLVSAPSDVRWLTGYAGSNGAVLVAADAAEDRLVTDDRYRERVRDLGLPHVETGRRVGQVVADLGGVRLAVDAEHLTVATAERLRAALADGATLVTAAAPLADLRATKDAAEVARLAVACAITAEALAWLGTQRVEGVAERDLARALEARFLALGADGVAFPSIVAAGVNGASPHHEPTDRPVARGELVTVDCGAEVDGYRADMTRTLAAGPVAGRMAEVHAVVEAANAAGRAAAVTGATVGEVDAAARGVVAAAGHAEAFVHPTGHGVGLDVHEAPLVAAGGTATLRPGTTVTVEPGIYLPGVGGARVEDTLAVGTDGTRVLTVMDRRPLGA